MLSFRFYSFLLLPRLRVFGYAGFFLWFSPDRLMVSLLTSFLHFLLLLNFLRGTSSFTFAEPFFFLIPRNFLFISFPMRGTSSFDFTEPLFSVSGSLTHKVSRGPIYLGWNMVVQLGIRRPGVFFTTLWCRVGSILQCSSCSLWSRLVSGWINPSKKSPPTIREGSGKDNRSRS